MGSSYPSPAWQLSLSTIGALSAVFHQGNSDSAEKNLWDEFQSSRRHCTREELLRLYEPFAKSIAARMYSVRVDDSISFEDYLQYGRVGLLEAVDRYDFGRGVAFSTYSSARIRGAILSGIAKESEAAAQNRFWRERYRDRGESLITAVAPDVDRASLTDIATITMGLAIGAFLDELDHDITLEPSDPNPRNNPYAANEIYQLGTAVKQLIIHLPEKERAVISGHYIEGLEFQKVAIQLSISKGRVSQIHAQALLRLRSWLEHGKKLDQKF
jgi:RNA polymerase sigma factor for flagellar operon FliA